MSKRSLAASFIVFLALLVTTGYCQEINWKPCKDVTATLQGIVDRFNNGRTDGMKIDMYCTLSFSEAEKKAQKPEIRISLTEKEKSILNELRQKAHTAYAAQDAYEDLLMLDHGIKKPAFSDPCYHFVGIKVDDDFITNDPNPMMPYLCKHTAQPAHEGR